MEKVGGDDKAKKESKPKTFFWKKKKKKNEDKTAAPAPTSAAAPSTSVHQEAAVLAEVDRDWFWRRQMHEALYLVCAKVIRLICKDWKRFALDENRLEPGAVPEDCVVVSEEMHQEMEGAIFKILEAHIVSPKYDQSEFADALVKALTELLSRNGLKRHIKFATTRLAPLLNRHAFGVGVNEKEVYESFEDTSFRAASWFYWPKGNFLPSKQELRIVADQAAKIGPAQPLVRCTSSLQPVFEQDDSIDNRRKFCGFAPCEPSVNVSEATPTNAPPIFRSAAEGGS